MVKTAEGPVLEIAAVLVKIILEGIVMTQVVDQQEQRWIYNQRTGQLRHPNGWIDPHRGYSGAPGYVNNPEAEHLPNQGPIPRGQYRMERAVLHPVNGPMTIPLSPRGHNMRGRTGINAHGDRRGNLNRDASLGCPILILRQRRAMDSSGVRRFDVVDEPEWQQ